VAVTLIHGVVRSSGGVPIAEARVYLTQAPDDVPDIAALSNDEGRFTLGLTKPGTYRLECSAEGHETAGETVSVELAPEESARSLTFELRESRDSG
jgi:hypothetical protein